MYILFVDDEPIILRGVERSVRRRFPQHETAMYTNPIEALASIRKRMPDLLITDHYMPGLTGLELIKKAAELGCRHYAILTGYDDFTLVQKALRLQAADYLTKPVSKDDLYRLVESTQQQLDNKVVLPAADLISILRVLTFWDVNSGEFDMFQLDVDPRLRAQTAAMVLLPAQDIAFADKILQRHRNLELGLTPFEQYAFLLLDLTENEFQDTFRELQQSDRSICAAFGKTWNIGMLNDLYQSASKQNAQDARALSQLIEDPSHYAPLCSKLHSMIIRSGGHLPETLATLRQMVDSLGYCTPRWALLKLTNCLLGHGGDITEGVQRWISSLEAKPVLRSGQIIEALAYIDAHYAEKLSLPDLANQLFLQSSYLSNLFSKETGSPFIKHLNRIRIENACVFLAQFPDESLESLANRVGFSNPQYFFRVFKSLTDLTPGEFRKIYQTLSEHAISIAGAKSQGND